jgi:hypothetical protein
MIRSFLTAALLVWCSVAPLAWILRDGLGPDAVDSHGWAAFQRFLGTYHWGPVFLGLVVISSGWRWFCRRRCAAAR